MGLKNFFFAAVCVLACINLFAASPAQARGRSQPSADGNVAPQRRANEQRVNTASGGARFTAADGGQTVHDAALGVTWLVDANYPAKDSYGLAVAKTGAMDYATAQQWIQALNQHHYLGHTNWTLPTTPKNDDTCSKHRGPNGNSFGYGCRNSALGSLYYDGRVLNILPPNTAVPMPSVTTGPFRNIQPYLYWSGTANGKNQNGVSTFSFNTGWQGGNVSAHVMYALPMLDGHPLGGNPQNKNLQPVANGQAVYDGATDITWIADANVAASGLFSVPNVNKDGSMEHETAASALINALNTYRSPGFTTPGYLGQSKWTLPPAATPGHAVCGGFNCSDSPMGELFYRQLHLDAHPISVPPNAVGPFHDLQPYLYWSCEGDPGGRTCNGAVPADNFSFSFSFGNGYEGTDVDKNRLYVTAYYPDSALKCTNAETCCMQSGGTWFGGRCH